MKVESGLCANLLFRWIEAFLLRSDSTLWGVGRCGGQEEVGVVDRFYLQVCPGDQTTERVSVGRSRESFTLGQSRRISLAFESEWVEREHQRFFR